MVGPPLLDVLPLATVVERLIRLCLLGPEVDIEAGIFRQLDPVPVLGRAGSELAGPDHQADFGLFGLLVGKAVIGDGALHHAELAEHPGRRVVVAEQGLGHILAGEERGGAAHHPVRRYQLHGHRSSPCVAGSPGRCNERG